MQDRDKDDRGWQTARPQVEPRSERSAHDRGHERGGHQRGGYERGAGPGHGPSPDDWRQGYGGYGVSGRGPSPESGWTGAPGEADMLAYGRGETPYGLPDQDRQTPYGLSGDDRETLRGRHDRDRDVQNGLPGGIRGPGSRERGLDSFDHDVVRRKDAWSVPGPFTGRGPQGYRRPEIAIFDDVCERLTRHGLVDASGISVRVENGEVILEGEVDSRSAKRMAEDAADSVSGVRDVHNRLRVRHRD